MIDKIQLYIVTVFFAYLELFWDFISCFFVWDSFPSVSKSPLAV